MSLAAFLTSSAALQRQSGGASSSGATVSAPFVTLAGKSALPCALWPVSTSSFTPQSQMAIQSQYVAAFAADPAAFSGDRLVIGSANYKVNGVEFFANSAVSSESLYLAYADLDQRS